MSGFVLGIRCVLALVFVIAAAGKLADLPRFRRTVGELGAPRWAVGVVAIAIPLAELAVAGLLIPTSTATAGGLVAVGFLALFCATIARVMARGDSPDCGCFGSHGPSPVGPWTLARNVALGAIAAVVVLWGPGEPVGDAIAALDASPWAIAAAALLAIQGWFAWQLFRQHGRLIERIRALEAEVASPPSATDPLRVHIRPGAPANGASSNNGIDRRSVQVG